MFAIQYALIVCNVISCIPAIPAIIFPVDHEKFTAAFNRFFDPAPPEECLSLIKLLMKFQFIALVAVYVLGIFAAFYVPTPIVGYMLAVGNLLRVCYIVIKMLDTKTWVLGGFRKETIKTILIIQGVLGVVIAGCTYLSSTNADYQAYVAEMAVGAASKWETDSFFIKFLLGAHGFLILLQIPGVVAPGFAIKNYVTVDAKRPQKDKAAQVVLEFVVGFQQLAILMVQVFGAVMLLYAPSIDGIAIYWILSAAYFTLNVFVYNIVWAEAYGFDRIPMIVFLILNAFIAGASFQALNA